MKVLYFQGLQLPSVWSGVTPCVANNGFVFPFAFFGWGWEVCCYTLVLVWYNDIFLSVMNSELNLYADDSILQFSGSNVV